MNEEHYNGCLSCADREVNIEEIDLSERDEYCMVARLTISVKDRKHLVIPSEFYENLRQLSG